MVMNACFPLFVLPVAKESGRTEGVGAEKIRVPRFLRISTRNFRPHQILLLLANQILGLLFMRRRVI
jgi:hypothetical protein